MDYNDIYKTLVLRENKKRKTNDSSTLREEPIPNEVDDNDFLGQPRDDEEEALTHEEEETPRKETTQPPPNIFTI